MEGWPAGLEPAPTGITTPDASVYTTTTTSGDDRVRTGGLSPDKRALLPVWATSPKGELEGGIGSPQPETETLPSESAPEPAVTHQRSCQRVSAPPPPHRLALEACRSQLHVRARALHQPLFCHFLDPPVDGSILIARVGFEPTVSSS